MCLGVAAVCSIAACCTPKAQLRVSQSGICKGNRVTITWTGTGDRFELQTGPMKALVPTAVQSVEANETLTAALSESTEFRLVAFRGKDEKPSDWQPVYVVAQDTGHRLPVDVNECAGSLVTARHPDPSLSPAEREYAANVYGGLLIDSVVLDAGDWQVEHAGRQTDLHPGDKSAAFKGTSMNGEWTFRMALPAGASCDQAPRRLALAIFPQCP